ncbi:hypothetical protein F5Y01DRAFT_320549 [Xylaria sp. FL0043]|nr:hypothetical protein F5Y01DRAFT_320549 [Xylaria sp. FL0043]
MTTEQTTLAPPQATVSLADIRQTYSQTRLQFTKTRGVPRITREGGIAPDFITLTCLISKIYRTYGDELEPVRQFHPSRETPYSKGHTSSVSHTQISRHATSVVSRDATTTVSEGIIIKRPRKSILEQQTYALVSFITELRVRTHAPLREHPNIARLRGVGWDFEDEEATIPRPLLLEELAPQGALDNFCVRWNFVRLKFESKLDLARNIAEGIQSMHQCGIVHGDVKSENILIFPRRDADNEFVAKLTDFGHSVFGSSHSKSLPAFTPQWCAPELSPEGADFQTPKANGGMLKAAIELVSTEDREKHDSDLDLAVIELLMRRTIQLRPKHRNLEQCIKIINHYNEVNGHRIQSSPSNSHSRDLMMKELNVAIGHSTFSQTSHQLKAHIVESLLHVANDGKDPRRLATAWELSVCYFSGFGVETSFQRCSEWLSVASEGGIAAARDYVAILHEAMNLSYQVPPRKIQARQIPAVAEHQFELQAMKPESGDLDYTSSQESDYESGGEDVLKSPTEVATLRKMPDELFDTIISGTLEALQTYLQGNPEDLNSRDVEGNTLLLLAARRQRVDMLKLLVDQIDLDADIPNRSGHTVLHFLPVFDNATVRDLVPKLVQRRADIHREALAMPLGTEDVVLTPGIRCCSILNAILHGNLTLLECLLEASHAESSISQCQICETASRFRRILAVSLSIFQAGALAMLVAHVRARGNREDVGLETIKVWAGSNLLPLHEVPFDSVAIGALDLPDALFRAMKYGKRYVEALEETIALLLFTEKHVEALAYSMISEAVESNNREAVRYLLKEGERRQFKKSWWIRGPLDRSPFLRSISLGFREIFKLFLDYDPTVFQRRMEVGCWLPACKHRRKLWDQYRRVLLGHSRQTLLPASEKKHDFNPVKRALWLLIDSNHQDCFFLNAILDHADPALIIKAEDVVTLDGSQLEISKLKYASPTGDEITVVGTRLYSYERLLGVRQPSRLDGGISLSTPYCLQCSHQRQQFLIGSPTCTAPDHAGPAFASGDLSRNQTFGTPPESAFYGNCRKAGNESVSREKHKSEGEGVQQWTRCPPSREEYHQLVRGNIRDKGIDRKDLWSVVEIQAELGHPRSISYLREAILHGNTEALEEMLRRGWDPNGPPWARLQTPIHYAQSLTKLSSHFGELFKAWNPNLPQTDWKNSRSHAVVYQAYQKQHEGNHWTEWTSRLKTSEEILRSHGGKVLPAAAIFTSENETLRAWLFISLVLIYTLLFPLTFTYATEGTWTTMSVGQKPGFSYLWRLMSISLPPLPPLYLLFNSDVRTDITDWIV